MKLIICRNCASVISLSRDARSCPCGASQGAYLDGRNAIYSGPCIPLGFSNPEFADAIRHGSGIFEAFVIPEHSRWFRRVDEG